MDANHEGASGRDRQQDDVTPLRLWCSRSYAAPEEITDVALQPGEQLVGSGPVAAGDTVRWIIGDTTSGTGASAEVHILVKPTRPDLTTNLIINTDRRTYHLELRSTAATYMASISWNYPEDQLIAIRQQNVQADQAAPIATGVDVSALNFRYQIEGDNRLALHRTRTCRTKNWRF